MSSVITRVKARPRERISGYRFGYSAPEYFRDWVNDVWQRNRPGAVLDCLPTQHTPELWSELGGNLTHELLAMSRYVGLYVDLGQPLPPLRRWAETAAQGKEVGPEWDGEQGCGYIIQPSFHAQWLEGIWAMTDSDWFDWGIGLMLAFYDTREETALEFDPKEVSPLTDMFGDTLSRAIAWLVPWDANIGFQIGLPVNSQVYQTLVG